MYRIKLVRVFLPIDRSDRHDALWQILTVLTVIEDIVLLLLEGKSEEPSDDEWGQSLRRVICWRVVFEVAHFHEIEMLRLVQNSTLHTSIHVSLDLVLQLEVKPQAQRHVFQRGILRVIPWETDIAHELLIKLGQRIMNG